MENKTNTNTPSPFSDYSLSVKQASEITGFPIRKWFKWILEGLIASEPVLNAESIKGTSYASIAGHVFVPVSTLPKYYRQKFLESTLIADKLLSVDLIGYLETNGDVALIRLYDELALVKGFINLKRAAESGKTTKARQYASIHNIDLSTLYRKEAVFMQSDLKKLVSPSDHIYHARDMCRLSEDYAKFEWGKPNHLAKVQIQDKLSKESKAQGSAICKKCPYNRDSRSNAQLSEKYPEIVFSCEKSGNGMLYPASKDPFNRFLSSLSEQDLKFSREGNKA